MARDCRLVRREALLGGLLHAYLEFVMPMLDVALILVILISSRDKRSISSIG